MLAALVARVRDRRRRRREVAEASRAAAAWVAIFTAEVVRFHLGHGGFEMRSAYCPVCTSRVRYAGHGQLRPRT